MRVNGDNSNFFRDGIDSTSGTRLRSDNTSPSKNNSTPSNSFGPTNYTSRDNVEYDISDLNVSSFDSF